MRHFFSFLVLRSQAKIIRKSKVNLRECFVAISPNYAAICMEYLQNHAPLRETQNAQNNQNVNSSRTSSHSVQPVPPVRRFRRGSIASCSNIFQVEGQVIEVGFDYLNRVPRTKAIIGVQTVRPRDIPQASYNIDEPSTSAASCETDSPNSSAVVSADYADRADQKNEACDLQYSGQSDSYDSYSGSSGEDEEGENQGIGDSISSENLVNLQFSYRSLLDLFTKFF